MKRAFTLILLSSLLVFVSATSGFSQSFVPSYNLTGTWHRTDGLNFQFFQDGNNVTFTLLPPGVSHLFNGYYIAPNVVEGFLIRRITATGSLTLMKMILKINSASSMLEIGMLFDNDFPGDLPNGFTERFQLSRLN